MDNLSNGCTKQLTPNYLLTLVYTKDRLTIEDELQKLCNAYNDAIEKNMKLCKELNECKKMLPRYEYGDELDDETLGLYKCEEGDGYVEYFYSGTVNTQQHCTNETASSDSEHIKEQSVKDDSYHGIGFKRILKDVPKTSLQKIVDWYITFEGDVVYKLSEAKDNEGTLLDCIKWSVEYKYPFISFNIKYPGYSSIHGDELSLEKSSDIPGGYFEVSTIPNITRPMSISDYTLITLPHNLPMKSEFFLSVDYTSVCKDINTVIGKMLDHCGYKE
jgi:hypothetical protein